MYSLLIYDSINILAQIILKHQLGLKMTTKSHDNYICIHYIPVFYHHTMELGGWGRRVGVGEGTV